MEKGYVYIFTNPSFDNWVKIGKTDDIEKRLRELNAHSNIPLCFQCYVAYEVENPYEVERCIHKIIDNVDNSLRAREQLKNGRIREREFFKISPETAYEIFKEVAILRNDIEKLKCYGKA